MPPKDGTLSSASFTYAEATRRLTVPGADSVAISTAARESLSLGDFRVWPTTTAATSDTDVRWEVSGNIEFKLSSLCTVHVAPCDDWPFVVTLNHNWLDIQQRFFTFFQYDIFLRLSDTLSLIFLMKTYVQ